MFLATLGLALGTYLTITHFDTHVKLACSDSGEINCQKVTTSAQSHFLGMPVAVLGLAYFIGIWPLMLPFAWRMVDQRIRLLRLVASGVGVLFVLWLISAELLIIRNICLYCTAVHVTTIVLFAVVAMGTAYTAPIAPSGRRR